MLNPKSLQTLEGQAQEGPEAAAVTNAAGDAAPAPHGTHMAAYGPCLGAVAHLALAGHQTVPTAAAVAAGTL